MMLKEFRDFAVRGNVLDLAVGVIIGGGFGKIVSSFTNDLLMPPVGLLLGKVDFSNLYINLSGRSVESLAEAKKLGIPTLNYGIFLNSLIDFSLVAFSVFLLVRMVNRWKGAVVPEQPAAAPLTQECPFCASAISLKATKCPHCTSVLKASLPV